MRRRVRARADRRRRWRARAQRPRERRRQVRGEVGDRVECEEAARRVLLELCVVDDAVERQRHRVVPVPRDTRELTAHLAAPRAIRARRRRAAAGLIHRHARRAVARGARDEHARRGQREIRIHAILSGAERHAAFAEEGARGYFASVAWSQPSPCDCVPPAEGSALGPIIAPPVWRQLPPNSME